MTPLDWITPERVWNSVDILGILLAVGLGLASLYLWLNGPTFAVFFGFDAYLWIAIGWFGVAVLSLATWQFRRKTLYSS